MATLIHKVNLLLLEYDSINDLKNISNLIFTDKLLNTLIDFCMNTENFANFGIRLIEILSLEFTKKIARSEIFAVIQGLMRTNDYETVAQSLSFISVMAQQIGAQENEFLLAQKGKMPQAAADEKDEEKKSMPPLKLADVLTPKLLVLILSTVSKLPGSSQIEFVHYCLEIVNTAIQNPQLREVVLNSDLPGMKPFVSPQNEDDVTTTASAQPRQSPNYISYLKVLEGLPQFTSIKKLHQKIARQRKELEFWQKSKKNKAD